MAKKQEQPQAEAQTVEESSALDALFEKVDMTPPEEGDLDSPSAKLSAGTSVVDFVGDDGRPRSGAR